MDAKKNSSAHVPETERRKVESGNGDAAEERHVHRERDVGVGYGNSSGYGTEQHFTDGHADPIFRVG
jgi:hypothetical protein